MTDEPGRRVLLAAHAGEGPPLGEVLSGPGLQDWEVVHADDSGRARFLLQHHACDAVLLDQDLLAREGWPGLEWLRAGGDTPVILLGDPDPQAITAALRAGVRQWLPRELVLKHPPLLTAALNQAVRDRPAANASPISPDRRAQRDPLKRLVDLLWEATPVSGRARWLTQRHALERLHEEASRAERYGWPLSVVLGEVENPRATACDGDCPALTTATGERIATSLRRSVVAGRYGPSGFLLLLINTPEPGAQVCCRRLRGLLEPAGLRVHCGVAARGPASPRALGLLGAAEQRLERTRQTAAAPCASGGADQ